MQKSPISAKTLFRKIYWNTVELGRQYSIRTTSTSLPAPRPSFSAINQTVISIIRWCIRGEHAYTKPLANTYAINKLTRNDTSVFSNNVTRFTCCPRLSLKVTFWDKNCFTWIWLGLWTHVTHGHNVIRIAQRCFTSEPIFRNIITQV